MYLCFSKRNTETHKVVHYYNAYKHSHSLVLIGVLTISAECPLPSTFDI